MKFIKPMLLGLGLLGLGLLATGATAVDHHDCKEGAPPEAGAQPERVDVGNAPTRGPRNAPVTLVVFSDFQCPFCARAEHTVQQLQERYGDRLRVAFKNQPLPMHAHAREAARAALAAQHQGKFWEMHDLLFAHANHLGREDLEGYARQLGLDLARFRADLDSPASDAAIDADREEAARLGVTGTPTFFVNGRRVVGAQPLETFVQAVEAELGR